MLMDQNATYKNAVGQPSIASRIGSDEIPNVVSMGRRAGSIGSARISTTKRNSLGIANEMIAPKAPRSLGSAAGYRGEKSAYLEMNGSGYMGSTRRSYSRATINNVRGAVLESPKFKKGSNLTGRLSENSVKRMKNLKSLNRLV